MFSSSYIIKAIDQFTPTANRVSQGFDKIAAKADKASSLTSKFSAAINKMSAVQSIATGAVSYYVFDILRSFSEQMQGVRSVANETTVSFEKLEWQAKELGRTTRYTATDAAAAQYFLAKAGYDTQKIYDSMPQTLLLASAANLDIAQSADIVTNIMAGYDMTAQQLTEAVDVLAKSFSSSNTDLVDLSYAMKYAGPVAHGMGIDFKESAAAIGMMGNAGIQGTMAGTSLRGALVRLSNPTKQVQRIIRGLKLDIYNSNGSLKSLTDIIEQLEKKNVSAAHMMAIFGQRAGPAMVALVSQGSAELRRFTEELDKAGGFAQRAADIRMEGFYGMWEELKSAAEGFVHAISDAGVMNILLGIGNTLTWLINLFSKILNLVSKISSSLGGKIGEFIGWTAAKISSSDYKQITPEEAQAFWENKKRQDILRSEIQMQLQINDKNNNVGNVTTSMSGAGNLNMDVGRSSAGG